MSTSIDQAFVKQFESDVFVAYQRMGSKFRNTIRTKDGVVGASDIFFKVGKGSAAPKTRHGLIPTMNVGHSYVECFLADQYAADWVDKLDRLKTNIDEIQLMANAGAYALGRKTDDIIITALATGANAKNVANGGVGLTKTKVLTGFEVFNGTDVPDDGMRFWSVGAQQWNNLLAIPEFISADYVDYEELPWEQGMTAKRWLGIMFYMHSGLPLATTTRTTFLYHYSSAGHCIAQDVETDITWHGDRGAHFVSNAMSMGAVKIDDAGILKVDCTEV
jgi:Phage capsid protein